MKALSLWQPWASAIMHGSKTVETRDWSTKYRGPLLIHAARQAMGVDTRNFSSVEFTLGRLPERIPFGALIGVCQITDVRPTEELELDVSPIERIWGDYSWGRFGFVLANVRAFLEPIGFTGRQKFFIVPDDIVAAAIETSVAVPYRGQLK